VAQISLQPPQPSGLLQFLPSQSPRLADDENVFLFFTLDAKQLTTGDDGYQPPATFFPSYTVPLTGRAKRCKHFTVHAGIGFAKRIGAESKDCSSIVFVIAVVSPTGF